MAIVADRKLLASGQERDVQFGLADIDTDYHLLHHLPSSSTIFFPTRLLPSLWRDTGLAIPRDCTGSDLALGGVATSLRYSLYGLGGKRSATPQLLPSLGLIRQDTRGFEPPVLFWFLPSATKRPHPQASEASAADEFGPPALVWLYRLLSIHPERDPDCQARDRDPPAPETFQAEGTSDSCCSEIRELTFGLTNKNTG